MGKPAKGSPSAARARGAPRQATSPAWAAVVAPRRSLRRQDPMATLSAEERSVWRPCWTSTATVGSVPSLVRRSPQMSAIPAKRTAPSSRMGTLGRCQQPHACLQSNRSEMVAAQATASPGTSRNTLSPVTSATPTSTAAAATQVRSDEPDRRADALEPVLVVAQVVDRQRVERDSGWVRGPHRRTAVSCRRCVAHIVKPILRLCPWHEHHPADHRNAGAEVERRALCRATEDRADRQ